MSSTNLTFVNYYISESSVKLNRKFFDEKMREAKLSPRFSFALVKRSESDAEAVLRIDVAADEKSPFELHMVMNGVFSFPGWSDSIEKREILEFTSIQILYPYLRQAVSSLTSQLSIAPFVLPIIDVRELLRSKKQHSQNSQSAEKQNESKR